MKIEYIPYRDEFRDDLIEMIKSLYSEDPSGKEMSNKKIERTISFLQSNPDTGRIVMITEAAMVSGYAIIVYFWSNEYGGPVLLLDELFIREEFRGKGIGKGFIKNLISIETGKSKAIFLEVIPSNTRAMEFYQNAGFQLNVNKFHRYLLNSQE
jgi:GNAT superfamily N-acetyltransferase